MVSLVRDGLVVDAKDLEKLRCVGDGYMSEEEKMERNRIIDAGVAAIPNEKGEFSWVGSCEDASKIAEAYEKFSNHQRSMATKGRCLIMAEYFREMVAVFESHKSPKNRELDIKYANEKGEEVNLGTTRGAKAVLSSMLSICTSEEECVVLLKNLDNIAKEAMNLRVLELNVERQILSALGNGKEASCNKNDELKAEKEEAEEIER